MANGPAFLAALLKCPSGTCGLWNIAQAGGVGNSSNEGGIDCVAAPGTPVYALAAGQLRGAGYFCHASCKTCTDGSFSNSTPACANGHPGYGVVTIRCTVPGYGSNDIYYQHIVIDPSIKLYPNGTTSGPNIAKGQLIGTVSQQGETEIGFNATNWGMIWGPDPHPAAWSNTPDVLIRALVNADPSFNWGTQTQAGTGGAGGPGIVQKAGLIIAPNDNVAIILNAVDTALEIVNPFDVTTNTDYTVFGIINTGIADPTSYVVDVLGNIGYDASALIVRFIFLLIGIGILLAIGQNLASTTTQNQANMVGGAQGIMGIVGALA